MNHNSKGEKCFSQCGFDDVEPIKEALLKAIK